MTEHFTIPRRLAGGGDIPTPSPRHDRHHSAQQLRVLSHLVMGDVTGTMEASCSGHGQESPLAQEGPGQTLLPWPPMGSQHGCLCPGAHP